MERILILGTTGLLGRHIFNKIKNIKNISVFHTGLKKRKIDLTNRIKLKKLISSIKPDLIINCIGFTNIEECEKNPNISKKINVEIVREIFKIKNKEQINFKFIHISTDQFYNQKKENSSSENSKIFLMNKYCKHKRMAEIICSNNHALIFRTNFFGKSISKNLSFSDWIFEAFKSGKKINLFNDVYFNPLRITTIAKILSLIVSKKKYGYSGIYNLGSRDAIYKDKFAILFAKKIKIFHNNYITINVNQILKVKRSNNMYMDTRKFEKKFQIKLPSIRTEINNEAKGYI